MKDKEVDGDSFCDVYGSIPDKNVGLMFHNRRDLYCIHNSICPIAIGPEGPYSILLLRKQNLNDRGYSVGFNTGETQKFKGDKNVKPEGQFNLNLMTSMKSQLPIRLIRASFLKNCYAPTRGFRYDGLYYCKEYETDVVKNKLVFKFLLSRKEDEAPVPWETGNQAHQVHPSTDMMEITAEPYPPSYNHVSSDKDALKFQVIINECFCLKEERYKRIVTSDSFSFKEEVVDPQYSPGPSHTAQEIINITEKSSERGRCDRKPLVISSDRVYQVDSDVDNNVVTELLTASGIISKDIVIPEDFYDCKELVDIYPEPDLHETTYCNDVKMSVDYENNGECCSVTCSNDSESESDEPYHIKLEVDEKPLVNHVGELSREISCETQCNVSIIDENHSEQSVNQDRRTSRNEDSLICLSSNTCQTNTDTYCVQERLKTEPVPFNEDQTIVPSPNMSESPLECNSIIKVNNSPLILVSEQERSNYSSQNDSVVVNDFTSCNGDDTYTDNIIIKTRNSSESVVGCDLKHQPDQYVVKSSNSPQGNEWLTCTSLEGDDVVPTTSYIVVSPEQRYVAELTDGDVELKHYPTNLDDNESCLNRVNDKEYIALEINSDSDPAQSDDEEIDDRTGWWYDRKSDNEVKLQNLKLDFGSAGNRISMSDGTYRNCKCSPPSQLVEPLLGNLAPLFSMFHSDFICNCKASKVSMQNRAENIFTAYKEIVSRLERLEQHDAKHIMSMLVFFCFGRFYEDDKMDDPLSTPAPRTAPVASLSKTVRNQKGRRKMVLTDDKNSKYDLIETDEGRFSLVKQLNDFDPSLPTLFELDKVLLNGRLSGLLDISESPKLTKSADVIEKVTRVPLKRIRDLNASKPARKCGRWKRARRKNEVKGCTVDTDPTSPLRTEQSAVCPSSVETPHLLGFTNFDVRSAEQRRDTVDEALASHLYFPPRPHDNFRGFSNYDIMKCRISDRLFCQAQTDSPESAAPLALSSNNVKKKKSVYK